MEQKTIDFTKNQPEERDLTIQEQLLLTHMQTIGNQLKLLGKLAILEDRINKIEQTIQHINEWEVYSNDDPDITEKFFE